MKSSRSFLIEPLDRLLTAPEPNAAGRLGLFRIVFALFYLWSMVEYRPGMLYGVPEQFRETVALNGWYALDPPLWFFELLGPVLIGALVLLLLGLRTRMATVVVLVVGGLLEAYFTSLDLESGSIFLKAYIPLFVLLAGDWGATYSIDAHLRRRAGQSVVDPSDASLRFSLPIRAVLVVLSVLFFSGAVWKSLPSSPWFHQENLFGNLMVATRVENAMKGYPLNPLAGWFLDYPLLDLSMRWFVVLFEGLFFLSLLDRRIRAVFVSLALVFHAVNAIWMHVTFSAVMIVYGLFVDWQALKTRLMRVVPGLRTRLREVGEAIPPPVWVGGGFCASIGAGVLWSVSDVPRAVVSLGGIVNWHTIWYPVLPLAMVWLVFALWALVGGISLEPERSPQR